MFNNLTLNRDLAVEGYIRSSNVCYARHSFSRDCELYSVVLEPVDPDFFHDLANEILLETQDHGLATEWRKRDIITFDSINKPLTSLAPDTEFPIGSHVSVKVRFEVATTEDGEHSFIRPYLRFCDEVYEQESDSWPNAEEDIYVF